jgi:hypothetical protein
VTDRVQITLHPESAKDILADLGRMDSWCRGYTCALPVHDRAILGPHGHSGLVDAVTVFRGAINDHEEGKDPTDDALVELMRTASAACNATRNREDRLPYQIAAHLHDEIVNLRRKLKGEPPLDDTAPWPFGDRP